VDQHQRISQPAFIVRKVSARSFVEFDRHGVATSYACENEDS
jgi:hypothetical protein